MKTNVETLNEYQRESRQTWSLIHTDHPIVYPTLGLVNEAGELAGKVKKIFRDKDGAIGEEERRRSSTNWVTSSGIWLRSQPSWT